MMINRRQAIIVGLGGLGCALPGNAAAQSRGQFSGNPRLEALTGRNMRLLREFRYRDPRGRLWRVPRNFVSDGASIPELLWSIEGGPWSGSYRDAAIVHDRYCDIMRRSWKDTHRVFYDAMISRAIPVKEALRKYWAVKTFGPRWDETYRWTGFMELNKTLRRPRIGGPPPPPPPPPSPAAIAAELITDRKYLRYQEEEYAKAAREIGRADLTAAQTAEIEPDTTFDYDIEYENVFRLLEERELGPRGGTSILPDDMILPGNTPAVDPAIVDPGPVETGNPDSIWQDPLRQKGG